MRSGRDRCDGVAVFDQARCSNEVEDEDGTATATRRRATTSLLGFSETYIL